MDLPGVSVRLDAAPGWSFHVSPQLSSSGYVCPTSRCWKMWQSQTSRHRYESATSAQYGHQGGTPHDVLYGVERRRGSQEAGIRQTPCMLCFPRLLLPQASSCILMQDPGTSSLLFLPLKRSITSPASFPQISKIRTRVSICQQGHGARLSIDYVVSFPVLQLSHFAGFLGL